MTARLLLYILLLFVVVDDTVAQSFDDRQLQQQSFFYRANYSADFQALRDTFCIGDPPVLQVSCYSKNMRILGTSNETIVCTELPVPIVENATTYECVNTCSGSACELIYLANDNRPSTEGPFGSIWFMCEGNDVQQLEAVLVYLGGNNGTCAAATSGSTTRNLHIGRLGVSCPVGSSRAYLYDDTYVECYDANSIPYVDPDDVFSCEIGINCNGQSCTVPFNDMYILSFVPQILDTCVEATIPITEYPTASPVVSGGVAVSARFEASWGNLFDPTDSASTCTSENPTAILSCGNGGLIEYVLSINNAAECTKINESELQCTGDASSIVNQFSSVIFSCTGPSIPSSQVRYTGSEAVCVGNTASSSVRHAVTLGLHCNFDQDPFFFYDDAYFECADASYTYERVCNQYGFERCLVICSTSAAFATGSTSADSQLIPDVARATDATWLVSTEKECYQISNVEPTPAAPTSPTPPPASTSAPARSPTINSQVAPQEIPSPNTTPRGTPQIESEDSNAPIGAIVGGVFGGIALALVVLGFVLLRNKSSTNTSNGASDGPKPEISYGQSTSATGTGTGTAYDHDSTPAIPPAYGGQYDAQSNGTAITRTSQTIATEGTPMNTSSTSTGVLPSSQPQYDVNFKDQARSVIGPSQPMPTVTGVPVQENIPIAVALDVSGASGGSRSEPPGRRMEEA